jgi:flagellar biosynthesis/type III secretory pathway chaperone
VNARDQDLLSGWLAEAHGLHERLQAVLRREQQALIRQRADDLESAVADKRALLDQIHAHEQSLQRLRHAAARDAGRATIEAWIRDSGGASHWQRWLELQAVAGNNREQNRANGLLVEQSRRCIEQAIALLSGQTPEVPGYGKTSTPVAGGRLIAST